MNFNKTKLKNDQKSISKNDIQMSNEHAALCVVEKLWNIFDIKSENFIDLFNDSIYNGLTKKGKNKFKKYILPHLKLKAYNLEALKLLDDENIGSSKEGMNKNNLKYNIDKLKRIANENDVSLLLNFNDTHLLNTKKKEGRMLIISKKTFINIIKEKIKTENRLLNPDNYILDTLLEISKNKKQFFINKEKGKIMDKFKLYRYYDYPFEQRLNNAHSKVVNYIIKKNFKKNDNNGDEAGNILKKLDYEVMEKENMLNKIIHESILQVSKKNKSNPTKDETNHIKNNFGNCNFYNINHKKFMYRETLLKRKEKKCKDPLYILKKFLEKDRNDLNYKQNTIIRELQECTFQPNVYKYLSREKSDMTQKKRKNIIEKIKKEDQVIENIFSDNTDSIIAKEVYEHILKQNAKKYYNTTSEDMNYFNSHFLENRNNYGRIDRKHEDPTHRICRNARRTGLINYNNKINSRMIKINYENNWNNEIRLNGRGLNAKIIPNFNLYQKINNMSIRTNNEHLSGKMVEYQNFNRKKQMTNSTSTKSNNNNVKKINPRIKNDISYSVGKNDFMKSVMFNSINIIEPKTPKIIGVEDNDANLEKIEKLLLSLPNKFYFASMC
ncbi:hypothetical protein YYE_00103 [Plasmodium vinckei vinckei]|nr:hypothetical protein YYE_00103 [Plasmodium vinckei vinckei]